MTDGETPEKVELPAAFWRGKSGKEYAFQLEVFGAHYKPVPGIYICCVAAQDGLWAAVYLGVTENLEKTLSTELVDHPHLRCLHKTGVTHVTTLSMPQSPERVAIAQDLAAVLDPPCNRPENQR